MVAAVAEAAEVETVEVAGVAGAAGAGLSSNGFGPGSNFSEAVEEEDAVAVAVDRVAVDSRAGSMAAEVDGQ